MKMPTQKEVEDAGYTLIDGGGWLQIDPESSPEHWNELLGAYGFDPTCKELILCLVGFKEIHEESKE